MEEKKETRDGNTEELSRSNTRDTGNNDQTRSMHQNNRDKRTKTQWTHRRTEQAQHIMERDDTGIREVLTQLREVQERPQENQKEVTLCVGRTRQEMQLWIFEHTAREIKGLSSWITAQWEKMTAVITGGKGERERLMYKEVCQSLETAQRTSDTQLKGYLKTVALPRRSDRKEHYKRKEQPRNEPKEKTKWEQEQMSKNQSTRSKDEREEITITDLRSELTRMKKETQEWTYEHLSKDLKVIAKWMTKQAEEERTRKEDELREEKYKQAIKQITEETRNQLYDRITNDMRISMFNILKEIKDRDQEIKEGIDRHEMQKGQDDERMTEMMKRNSEAMVNQIMTMLKEEQEQMWKWITVRVREMEEHVRPIHRRRNHWRYHGSSHRDQRSESGRATAPHHEERSESQHDRQTPLESTAGDEGTQDHKTYEEEEEEDHPEIPTHMSQDHIKRRLIRTLKGHTTSAPRCSLTT